MMTELKKTKLGIVGMCFKEHGQPYLTLSSYQSDLIKHSDLQNKKIKEGLENISILKNENNKLKYENELFLKELIETKMELAYKQAENDALRLKCS